MLFGKKQQQIDALSGRVAKLLDERSILEMDLAQARNRIKALKADLLTAKATAEAASKELEEIRRKRSEAAKKAAATKRAAKEAAAMQEVDTQ